MNPANMKYSVILPLMLLVSPSLGLSPLSYIHSMRDKVANHLKLKGPNTPESSTLPEMNGQPIIQEQPLYNFKGDVVKNNKNNVENIFSLLADIDPEDTQPMLPNPTTDGFKAQPQDLPPVSNELPNNVDDHNFDIINGFTKQALMLSKEIEDIAATVTKVKTIYENQKNQQEIFNSLYPKDLNKNETDPNSSIFLDVFLEPSNIERMWEASVKSNDEDQLLQELTSVIMGAESRQGSALTLDPVTIIALLTLAAYLIRAVYQILTVTGRSLDAGFNPGNNPLGFSDVPQAMASIHNWLSPSKIQYSSEGRAIENAPPEEGGWLTMPGTLLALVKLQREAEHDCYQQMLCHHLQSRDGPPVAGEDLFIMISNYIYNEEDFSLYIDNALGMKSDCSKFTSQCPDKKMKDAQKIQMMYTAAANYLNSFAKRIIGH